MTDRPPPLVLNPAKRWKPEHRIKVWLGNDISTPKARRRARIADLWIDHAVLRTFWHNFDEVAPGVYRSNQPDAKRLAAYKARGIRSILTLRGVNNSATFAFEVEACAALGLTFRSVNLSARKLRPAENYLEMLDIFAQIEKPFLFHCKSGADRTGLAAAFYLIEHQSKRVDEVRDQLSSRYLHSRRASTGVLDHMLEAFRRTGEAKGMPLRTWLKEVYDPHALTAEFKATPWLKRPLR